MSQDAEDDLSNRLEVGVNCRASFWREHLPEVESFVADVVRRTLTALPEFRSLAQGHKCEIAILLTDDTEIQSLNKRYRGKDVPTNVLSFPSEEEPPVPDAPRLLGDVVLSAEAVAREAQAQHKSFTEHTAHLLVHGCLHLLGYDHEEDEDARRMEAKEIALLAEMSIANPYEERKVC